MNEHAQRIDDAIRAVRISMALRPGESEQRYERRVTDAIKTLEHTMRMPEPGSVLDFDLAELARVCTEMRIEIAGER